MYTRDTLLIITISIISKIIIVKISHKLVNQESIIIHTPVMHIIVTQKIATLNKSKSVNKLVVRHKIMINLLNLNNHHKEI